MTYEQHLALCFKDGEFVECALCKFAGKKITHHASPNRLDASKLEG